MAKGTMKSDYEMMIENSREGLYTVDLGYTICICNKYGHCITHGSKKFCDTFLKSYELQLEFPELFEERA